MNTNLGLDLLILHNMLLSHLLTIRSSPRNYMLRVLESSFFKVIFLEELNMLSLMEFNLKRIVYILGYHRALS